MTVSIADNMALQAARSAVENLSTRVEGCGQRVDKMPVPGDKFLLIHIVHT